MQVWTKQQWDGEKRMNKRNADEVDGIWWEFPVQITGSGGSQEVCLAGQAWEEALEASESLEQCWDKSPGKESKTEVFLLEAVAWEREAEGNVWSFSFFTTRWQDGGGISM